MRPLRQAHPTLWRRSAQRIAIVLACLCIALPDSRAQQLIEQHFDAATGYRIAHYRAPTPKTVPGGTTITLEVLERLVAQHSAVLIDVMPSDGIGPDPTTGIWHTPKPRDHMRGSVWLPDVGKGSLTPAIEAYFRTQLAKLTGSNLARPIILYCQADCWMSWNAVKRAASFGYTALYWYPDGTDGMRDFDVPLVRATPVPLLPTPPAQ